MKKAALLIVEECYGETNEQIECKPFSEYKTITLIKKVEDCKPFVASSVLIILRGIMIYFCVKSRRNSVLPY